MNFNSTAHFNWSMTHLPKKLTFSKVTFQRTMDDQFFEMDKSLLVHAEKHPEVLYLRGWKPEDMILLDQKTLQKEYLQGIYMILNEAKKQNIQYQPSRGQHRYEALIPFKGAEWFVVLEQQMRNLGSRKDIYWVPLKNPIIITCFSKKRNEVPRYTVNLDLLFTMEYQQLASVLYTDSEEFLTDLYENWYNSFEWNLETWKEKTFDVLDRTLSNVLGDIDDLDWPYFEIPTQDWKNDEYGWEVYESDEAESGW